MTSGAGNDALDGLGYLGRHCELLSDLIEEQTAELFAQRGIAIPVKSCSLVGALASRQPASASDLAGALGRSHQIIMQKLPKLIRLGLVERADDPADKRRSLLRLTAQGRDQMDRLQEVLPLIEAAYAQIERQIGPVRAPLLAALEALQSRSLAERVTD